LPSLFLKAKCATSPPAQNALPSPLITITLAIWDLLHSCKRGMIFRAMLPLSELSFLGRLRVMVRTPYCEPKSTSFGSSPGSSLISVEEANYGG